MHYFVNWVFDFWLEMGNSSSRIDKNEALHLCKERKRFIKQAVDSRYNLTAAHLSYVQSLRSIGSSLRRFAEAEIVIESPLSASAVTELEKTPSHSTYPSPSPSHDDAEQALDSPLHSEISRSPNAINYMRSGASTAVTVTLDPSLNRFLEDDSLTFAPPPPPPEMGPSWDFFDPTSATENSCATRENYMNNNAGTEPKKITEISGNLGVRSKTRNRLVSSISGGDNVLERFEDGGEETPRINDSEKALVVNAAAAAAAALEQHSSKKEKQAGQGQEQGRNLGTEREDPSEFITHRAKDFLSSVRDIEHRFFRASESGKEVSRMLEANKIQLSCSKNEGRSPASLFVAALHVACCRGEIDLSNEPPQQMTKVITWNRSISSQSSSSKNLLASASKVDVDDGGSEFFEDYSMITGSHSSTLDRIFAWERKLYDEVKASESIKKEYDQRCNQLRHQFARDASPHVIDKTRALIKDLHSQIRVALHSVDSIAKRIEKLRDEELQPQLVELVQGLTRMWKDMLECHHAQYITISLAYHVKNSTTGPAHRDSHRQAGLQLENEIGSFGSSFTNWVDAHKCYIEALNGWLQTCITLPQERSSRRRAFSPRRALAPPIFVLCRDWAAGNKELPSVEVIDAIKGFGSDVRRTVMTRQVEEQQNTQGTGGGSSMEDSNNNGETDESREDEQSDKSCNVSSSIHTSLAKVLDRLTKFAEASRKMYEEIRQSSEAAQAAYTNCRATRL